MDDRGERGAEGAGGAAGSGDDAARGGGSNGEGILTLVCFKCGTEYYFADGGQPAEMTCEKCGNTVFRSFLSQDEEGDEVGDFEDSTGRDLRTDDAEGETLPGDLLDLDRG